MKIGEVINKLSIYLWLGKNVCVTKSLAPTVYNASASWEYQLAWCSPPFFLFHSLFQAPLFQRKSMEWWRESMFTYHGGFLKPGYTSLTAGILRYELSNTRDKVRMNSDSPVSGIHTISYRFYSIVSCISILSSITPIHYHSGGELSSYKMARTRSKLCPENMRHACVCFVGCQLTKG